MLQYHQLFEYQLASLIGHLSAEVRLELQTDIPNRDLAVVVEVLEDLQMMALEEAEGGHLQTRALEVAGEHLIEVEVEAEERLSEAKEVEEGHLIAETVVVGVDHCPSKVEVVYFLLAKHLW